MTYNELQCSVISYNNSTFPGHYAYFPLNLKRKRETKDWTNEYSVIHSICLMKLTLTGTALSLHKSCRYIWNKRAQKKERTFLLLLISTWRVWILANLMENWTTVVRIDLMHDDVTSSKFTTKPRLYEIPRKPLTSSCCF